jgi:DAK2 domain fusion protein YloV
MINAEHHKLAQDFMDTADIEFGYCTEFMVKFEEEKLKENPFNEDEFRLELSEYGDSLLAVSDNDVVKIHIHAEQPGKVMTLAQKYGSLINIDIENMREQHTAIVGEKPKETTSGEKANYGIVTVAMGSGVKTLFESLGASVVIEGGQTMNPSTQDITNAINAAHANNILILPNNKNIVMAAEQAAKLAGDHVEVVLTETIPQGISALLAFNSGIDIVDNKKVMSDAKSHVKTGQVTYAVRDTKIDGITIEKGNFMGIADSKIKASHQEKQQTVKLLLEDLITEDDEIVTIIYGEDVNETEIAGLVEYIEETYEDIELEVYSGNQPIYSYIFSVE